MHIEYIIAKRTDLTDKEIGYTDDSHCRVLANLLRAGELHLLSSVSRRFPIALKNLVFAYTVSALSHKRFALRS